VSAAGCLDERGAFEAWFRNEYHDRLCRNMPDKSYNDPTAHATWGAWQARSASRQEGWISVDERLPSHEQEVICTGFEGNDPAKKRWQEFATFHECGLFYDTVLGEQLYPPTHWQPMPLPAAPHQSQEAQGDRHGE